MSTPPEFAEADLRRADPDLAGAPLAVRQASAWLAERDARPGSWKERWMMTVPVTSMVVGLIGASVAGDVFNSPVGAGVLFGVGVVGGMASLLAVLRHNRLRYLAMGVLQRYANVRDVMPEAASSEPSEASPLDRLVERVMALAGDQHPDVAHAAAAARARGLELERELRALTELTTGAPAANEALDEARTTLRAELDALQAAMAELYAGLVALGEGGPDDALQGAAARVRAAAEVKAMSAARRGRQLA
jgi:hypothetical protein